MMLDMRSTVRIDDDLMSELKSRAREEEISLTRMLNRVVRRGLKSAEVAVESPYTITTVSMGQPRVDLDKALALAADLDDEEVLRKISLNK